MSQPSSPIVMAGPGTQSALEILLFILPLANGEA
jgi:hypothetical protein